MSIQNGCVLTHEGIEYLCGLIRDINGLDTNLIDDLNIKSNGTFSSVRINTLLNALKTDCNDFANSLVSNISRLELKIVTDESSIVDSNILYLYKPPTGQNSYNQYVVIEGNKVLLGTTDINISDYYTITQADTKFTLKTDFDALKTEVDKKLNLTGGTMTGVLTINNNNPAINLSLQGQSTDKVAEDIRFVDGNGLTRSCVRSNVSALEIGQRTTKDGSKWYEGSALLLNNNGSFNLRASDSNGGNRKSLIGTSTDLKWDGNKVITEDQLSGYIPYFPKTIQFGHTVTATKDSKWVKIFEFTPNEYAWNGGNFIITFSSLNTVNSYYPFGEYELIWKCNSSGASGITDVYLNQIISQNGDVCHTKGSVLCVGISENNKTVGLYAFLGANVYQTMLATIISGGSRYENRQAEIAKWINIDKPTVGLEAQPTFSKANYYSLADNLGGWTYTATKLPVSNYNNVADVPYTKITLDTSIWTSGNVRYEVKNGICYVGIEGLTPKNKGVNIVISNSMPKPEIYVLETLSNLNTATVSINPIQARIAENSTTLVLHSNDNTGQVFGSFSYPVKES